MVRQDGNRERNRIKHMIFYVARAFCCCCCSCCSSSSWFNYIIERRRRLRTGPSHETQKVTTDPCWQRITAVCCHLVQGHHSPKLAVHHNSRLPSWTRLPWTLRFQSDTTRNQQTIPCHKIVCADAVNLLYFNQNQIAFEPLCNQKPKPITRTRSSLRKTCSSS